MSGKGDLFATIDYSGEEPVLYAGKEVSLQELSLNAGGAELKPEKRATITNLGCPHCGGALELRAPDATERVGCPYCGSLLDCTQGKFKLLQALGNKIEQPLLKLGSVAEFEGVPQILIGYLKRSCVIDNVKYFWTEYLLYNKDRGFRWLVHSVTIGHMSGRCRVPRFATRARPLITETNRSSAGRMRPRGWSWCWANLLEGDHWRDGRDERFHQPAADVVV